MIIKITGYIIIVLSCWCIGYVAGIRLNMRVKELRFLKMSLQMLETEISYSNTPLPMAFEAVASRSGQEIAGIFSSAASILKGRQFSTVGQAFEKAIGESAGRLSLSKEDIDILKAFGYTLGNSDAMNQIKNFNLVIKQLEAQEIKAEESRSKSERMYKNLGLLSGLAITVILM